MKSADLIDSPLILQRENGYKNLFLVYLPIILLFFQYQISTFYSEPDSIIRLTAGGILILSALILIFTSSDVKKTVSQLVLIVLIASIVLKDAIHMGLAGIFFLYGYNVIFMSERALNNILKILFFFNAVIMIIQLLGIDEFFYSFQTYSFETNYFVSFLDGDSDGLRVPSHQARMSGMFPSTISLSMLQFLVFGQLIVSKIYGKPTIYFFVGFIFAISSSTVSVVLLAIATIFLIKNKRIIYLHFGFSMGVFIIFYFFRSIFDYSYSLESRLSRVDTRLISDEGSSLLTSNAVGFFAIVVSLLGVVLFQKYFMLQQRRGNWLSLILFMVLVISPLIVHPIENDICYWFIVGTAFAQYIISQRSGLKLGTFNTSNHL